MNVQLLIDSIVRQVTVLIAQLATSGGVRAPVAHIANQVFVDLANELAAQGVSRKVSADMFGMALRAYIRKLRRLNESSTERAVLHDLTESSLVFVSGPASAPMYRAANEAELSRMRQVSSDDGLVELLWVLVYREGPLSHDALLKLVRMDEQRVQVALASLCASQRVQTESREGEPFYTAIDFSIPLDSRAGWEAAVFDHFQAMVQTISQRLEAQTRTARMQDEVGGSTYSYDVWPGHPLLDEARNQLHEFRAAHGALLERVTAYNREHGRPKDYEQVIFYGGQCVLERSLDHEGADEDA